MKTMETKEQKIQNLLTRNVETVIEKTHLEVALRSGKKLRVKLGIDPTSPDLHLGHAVVLRKLREFQDLGHKAVLIIGDFTARIGDPSGRDKTRPPLSPQEIKKNLKQYLVHAAKVLDIKKVEVRYNSEWLGKMKGGDLLHLLGMVSVQQIMERDDFQKRFMGHLPIRIHELIYPIMQGYDSVAVKADVELGGTDQTFNILMGRVIMEKFEMLSQDVLTVSLLVGLDGTKKMSKSLGNYIGLDDAPNDMFGKVMSIPDSLVADYFKFCTTLRDDEIKKILDPLVEGASAGAEWKKAKQHLAFEIVKLYHHEKKALAAQESFDKTFSKGDASGEAEVLKLKNGKISALDLVVASGVLKSKSEARRLIEQGGFEVAGQTLKNPLEVLVAKNGDMVRVGKKSFFKIRV